MNIVTKRRYVKKHVVGGAGLFDSVVNFFKLMATSNAVKTFASKLSNAAQTEFGKKAIEASKTVAKEVGMKEVDVGKDIAIAKATKFLDRATAAPTPVLTQKSKDVRVSLTAAPAMININRMLDVARGLWCERSAYSCERNEYSRFSKTFKLW